MPHRPPSSRPGSWPWLLRRAGDEVARTVASLPADVRDSVDQCAVLLEKAPGPDDIAEGIDPDTLGLFDGAGASENPLFPPPRIRLWLVNLWDYAGGDPEIFDEEVGITLLHELGHFLGLEEDDLDARGLG